MGPRFSRKKPPSDPREQHTLISQISENGSDVAGVSYEVLDYVVAMYPYKPTRPSELTFECGDTLEVLNKTDLDWWLARYPGHKNAGYIPAPYVAISSSLESYELTTADESPQLARGPSSCASPERTKAYVISVKIFASDNYTPCIKHYSITTSRNEQYAIGGNAFRSLADLMQHFVTHVPVGLPDTIPKHPCVRPAPP
ncbi:Tyrosine-protein kinase Yes [Chionoecetes opilio]|uniref:Tyrosine-protein kinase Yes n=1 Tax=Chionoecetes opilio TaxID=41210 RepID=A0A8J4XWB5_CHIOP|nr:Tyrosine-protein kinase Yes [Chionoecetes opilio]KAG0713177.1 Tyrosine-protein kinase Yes [Chionoecetes opilio]